MTTKGLIPQLMFTLLAIVVIALIGGGAQRQSEPTPSEKPWHHTTPAEDREWQLDRLTKCMDDPRLCDNETP